MKTNHVLNRLLVKSALIFGLITVGGCASAPHQTLESVGPKPQGVSSAEPVHGYLKVYSATETFNDGNLMYYPHSRYTVYNNGGTLFKHVENHSTNNNENPTVVPVPAGTYYIVAKSEFDGFVRVPVVIKGGKTTVVNLERIRKSDHDTQGVDSLNAVKSANGDIVGWRAPSS